MKGRIMYSKNTKMFSKLKFNYRNKSGFTLIEILVVIAIICLLASIVLVGLGGFRSRGRDARRISDLRQVQNGFELYFNKCGYYPGGATTGVCNTTNPTTWTNVQDALINAQIGITTIGSDPTPGVSYGYAVSTNRQSYIVGATMEDANNQSLAQDYDGALTGYTGTTGFTSCVDPVYCIQF